MSGGVPATGEANGLMRGSSHGRVLPHPRPRVDRLPVRDAMRMIPPDEAPASGRSTRPRVVGINHVALEVGDVDEALAFYGRLFEITLRGRLAGMAFVDMGDQFIALSERRGQEPDGARHFGLVVDDREAVRDALREAGIEPLPGRGLDFRDPWGNRVQVVDYRDIQFTKAPEVLRGMGLEHLGKSDRARNELRQKGLS
jgi:catechol 2,3-dioxygenase-like lactoylglutathione lyase family enzyme